MRGRSVIARRWAYWRAVVSYLGVEATAALYARDRTWTQAAVAAGVLLLWSSLLCWALFALAALAVGG